MWIYRRKAAGRLGGCLKGWRMTGLRHFPGIDALVCGPAEIGSLHRRMEQLEFADLIDGVSLSGYGGVRNVGLVLGSVLGSEVVVFVDDDQVITDLSFLARAVEGIGQRDGQGRTVLAKSGYYVDDVGAYAWRVRHPGPKRLASGELYKKSNRCNGTKG